jgi:hypothetical protein
MAWNNKHISGFCIAALLYSGLPHSFCDHHDVSLHCERGLCKVTADSWPADREAVYQPMGPCFTALHVFADAIFPVADAPAEGKIARSPPISLPDSPRTKAVTKSPG